jgi:type III pantothenate kinase
MVLTIDLGNSQIVAGVFKDQQLRGVWRLVTDQTKTADEYGVLFSSHMAKNGIQVNEISGCIMSSVVPGMTPTFEMMVKSLFHQDLIPVSSNSPHGLTLRYDHPEEIGTDRLVNAAAGFARYRTCLIIVDFGTATTFCTITEDGEYLGGVIAPGLKSSRDSLFHQTAKLPMVDLVQPKTVIGTNTVAGLQSGLIFGPLLLARAVWLRSSLQYLGQFKKLDQISPLKGWNCFIAECILVVDNSFPVY